MTHHRPKIAARMANGDEHTAAWLLGAKFHKIDKGASKGTWIAWKKGKLAYITEDHPSGLGCCWLDHDALDTLEKAIEYAEANAL